MCDFAPVLSQINFAGIATLASNIRRRNDQGNATSGLFAPFHACQVDNVPVSGSFNLVYFITFDDQQRWVLKVPGQGYDGTWDELASKALTSEAGTMRLIKDQSNVPVPEVYGFDSSMRNPLRVPYIMMEHISGRTLDEMWWASGCSIAKQQQIRLRILQTLAEAMADLSTLTFPQGGALQFDANGEYIGIGGTRVIDLHAMFTSDEPGSHVVFTAKGPTNNPQFDLLTMLRKRDAPQNETALERGQFQALKLFATWAMEDRNYDGVDDFVLAHPDLDTQNILVQNDGTLCGIIDWDGVAAVPHERGALRYPLFISRDWDPRNYNYDPTTGGERWPHGRMEEGPLAQDFYRSIYAHFMETELASLIDTDQEAKRVNMLTRYSHLVACIETAASNPWSTECNLQHIFDQLKSVADELGAAGGLESNEEPGGINEESRTNGSEYPEGLALSSHGSQASPGRTIDSHQEEGQVESLLDDVVHSATPTEPQEGSTAIAEKTPSQNTCDEEYSVEALRTPNNNDKDDVGDVDLVQSLLDFGQWGFKKATSLLRCEESDPRATDSGTSDTSDQGSCPTEKTKSINPNTPVIFSLKQRFEFMLAWVKEKLRVLFRLSPTITEEQVNGCIKISKAQTIDLRQRHAQTPALINVREGLDVDAKGAKSCAVAWTPLPLPKLKHTVQSCSQAKKEDHVPKEVVGPGNKEASIIDNDADILDEAERSRLACQQAKRHEAAKSTIISERSHSLAHSPIGSQHVRMDKEDVHREHPTSKWPGGAVSDGQSEQTTSSDKPFSRNQKCPCGSRRKFKKCHGKGHPHATVAEALKLACSEIGSSSEASGSLDSGVSAKATAGGDTPTSQADSDGDVALGSDVVGENEDKGSHSDQQGQVGNNETANNEATNDSGSGRPETANNPAANVTGSGRPGTEDDPTWDMDTGRFRMNDILVALGKRNLDRERHQRLKSAFMLLLGSFAGIY